jgi:hypothetical protein
MTSPKDHEERDTQPPGPPDPIMGAVERLEGKIDTLTSMCARIFDTLQEQRLELNETKSELDFVKRRLDTDRPPPNGADHAG